MRGDGDAPGVRSGAQLTVEGVPVHDVAYGVEDRTPIVILHGAGTDHREMVGCLEPILQEAQEYRRVYPDSPGMGRTPAPESLTSADDVLDVLSEFVDQVSRGGPCLLVGHSAGGYFAAALAERLGARVAGLALLCPFVEDLIDVPAHVVVHAEDGLDAVGTWSPAEEDAFASYFVVHTSATRERYRTWVAPGVRRADHEAMERIGARWRLSMERTFEPCPDRPVLIIAGRQDSAVGYAAQWDLLASYPRATFAVLDRAGHALPHEQPEVVGALLREWLQRVGEAGVA